MQENIMQTINYVLNDVTEFSKDTYTISHTVLIAEVMRYELDKCKITWAENCIDHYAQSVVIITVTSNWCLDSNSCFPSGISIWAITDQWFTKSFSDSMECNLNKFEGNNVRKSGQYAVGGGRKDCQTDCTTG